MIKSNAGNEKRQSQDIDFLKTSKNNLAKSISGVL